jgi:molybdate transport system substrate-binding protein
LGIALLALVSHGTVVAGEATVAVAANFSAAAHELSLAFQAQSEHGIVIATGSTGQIYAQILQGAPYDAFLAADSERPRLLESAGLVAHGSRFTYAIGTLVLWSARPELLDRASLAIVEDERVHHIAIANPALAPYGAAARTALAADGKWERVMPKLAVAQSVGQAFAMVATGNAEVGFVAASQLADKSAAGSAVIIDPASYPPIRQDVVLLQRAAGNEAAVAFLNFLRSAAAAEILIRFGYQLP